MQHEARHRLGEDHLRLLYDKASLGYEQHVLLTEAIEVALYAQDFARAAVLIERLVEPQHLNEVLHTLYRWIEKLPGEVLQAHPALCLTYAMILLFTHDRSAPATRSLLEVPLQMAEHYWQAEGNRPKLGEVLALRSQVALWQGDLPQAFAAARQALEWVPSNELLWRSSSMLTAGMEELLAGKLDAARQTTLAARACFEVSGNIYGTRATLFVLGEASTRRGEVHQAASLYRQVLAEAEEDALDRGSALVNLASLSYDWKELEGAQQHASHAPELGRESICTVGRATAEQVIQ